MSRLLVRNIDGKQVWRDVGPARARATLTSDALRGLVGTIGGELARPHPVAARRAQPPLDAGPCGAIVQRTKTPCVLRAGHSDHHRTTRGQTAGASRAYRQRHVDTYRERERARYQRRKGAA